MGNSTGKLCKFPQAKKQQKEGIIKPFIQLRGPQCFGAQGYERQGPMLSVVKREATLLEASDSDHLQTTSKVVEIEAYLIKEHDIIAATLWSFTALKTNMDDV